MDKQLNNAPCGFLTLSEEGSIIAVNRTLLNILKYDQEQVIGQHMDTILTVSAQLFYQLYFVPLLKLEKHIEEMYISLKTRDGEDIPVLVNAVVRADRGDSITECVLIPMRKRNEYENELLMAKNAAQEALHAKQKANAELEIALETLKAKQEELLESNKQNQQFKLNTKRELELARRIQENSLTEPIVNGQIQIDSYYKASSDLSGDLYGFYQIDEHRYGIIILDVMGHGISSALITMSLHPLFQRQITQGLGPVKVMKELDRHLHSLFQNDEEARHYCTAIYLVVDTARQKIDYVNAGHPPALWQDADGTQHLLQATSPPIGMFEDAVFQSKSLPYTKGGRLLLYTDGVMDPTASCYLFDLLKAHPDLPIADLKENILTSLDQHKEAQHQSDDECFILIDLK
ncbi:MULTISPECIES: SpoIIE family protein phosphatase [unclassified Bacillus (in: firmicutes)]|uniref:SpoIIE family protein phosphatase n=1 Tax=unclassified Bacillus (in: firmicutes) TaxID=185979 RepID=UPI00227E00DE|nr:SpoIIE family protein phosphatase [Bacillus sp. S20C3]MCY8204297.1 SpoIIE family protein phosphatase [Bacillus sp. N12A5]MCY8288663.1 SpoIIE family protein phosphatase [Bacillus sp. N13C7]MCY8636265.1 SpoIIE family protein phosphatase [Bacillus sp. S17B2]MCY8720856.1 SpoIIE family protein phosphatase [Bacillus sp. S10C12M]MCY9142328.1 SpoIIE family protein phosphatase [Bacillus sp. T9C1]